jgi:transcriptional regulator with XRE-family HTH domain
MAVVQLYAPRGLHSLRDSAEMRNINEEEAAMPTLQYGKVLRKLRKAAGKTLGDVAEFLGLSITYVSDVELANRAPFDRDRNIRLARFLNAAPDALLIPAAEWNGAYELESKSVSPKAREVGAMLMRGWKDFDDEELAELERIASRKVKAEG